MIISLMMKKIRRNNVKKNLKKNLIYVLPVGHANSDVMSYNSKDFSGFLKYLRQQR